MSISRLAKLLLATLIAIALGATAIQADDKSSKEKQLRAVLQKIEKLKKAIDVKEDSKSQYIKQLKTIEQQIGSVNDKIRAIGKEIRSRKSELATLRETRQRHQRKLSRENEHLAEQVYTAFTLGRQERVKLLFSQQDPERLQRNLVYYRYFSSARAALIEEVRNSIDEILATEDKIRAANSALEASQSELTGQKRQLDQDRARRESIVASLDKQLKQQGGNLSHLEDEAQQLQKLIDSIREILEDVPDNDLSQRAFAQLKGKLPWPVEGKVRRLFGKTKPYSDLRWQGVIIEAPSGRDVHAVSHGRVAFADWLRGLGNLIIVDHGNSYLSLYGHNESLYKNAGEWVESGEVIASTGNSGGQKKAGLYFEIRKQGKPQNPTRWCKA